MVASSGERTPSDASELIALPALVAAQWIREGRLDAKEYVDALLARIAEREDAVGAWTFIDPDYVRKQAREADEQRRRGRPMGPLHGVPIGIKDIFDTRDMPTEKGSVLHAGRRGRDDAAAIYLLRQAGAIIMGKTVATEFATYTPGKTRNPHDPTRTPGGSSSGSAAAVADAMVPLALGSQTNASIVRPASYCDVVGFKPTHGLISRAGCMPISRALDHVGVFARNLEDAAILAEILIDYDPQDPDTRPIARPPLRETLLQDPPVKPHLAFVRTPAWDRRDTGTDEAFAELVDVLGDSIAEVSLPDAFQHAADAHQVIMEADLAFNLRAEYEKGKDRMSERLLEMVERGLGYSAFRYNLALDAASRFITLLDSLFFEFDAIVTPAATGEAPVGLDSTGDPAFGTIWSLCGTPAVSLPLLRGPNGMPLGVQLVARRDDDARLLRTARWLTQQVDSA